MAYEVQSQISECKYILVPYNPNACRQQLRVFTGFVDQQRQMPVLKQFLKLYTTISLPKLAALMDTDEAAVKDQLKILEVTASSSLNALSNIIISLAKGQGCHNGRFAVSAGIAMV